MKATAASLCCPNCGSFEQYRKVRTVYEDSIIGVRGRSTGIGLMVGAAGLGLMGGGAEFRGDQRTLLSAKLVPPQHPEEGYKMLSDGGILFYIGAFLTTPGIALLWLDGFAVLPALITPIGIAAIFWAMRLLSDAQVKLKRDFLTASEKYERQWICLRCGEISEQDPACEKMI